MWCWDHGFWVQVHTTKTVGSYYLSISKYHFNTLRPRQDGRLFPDDIFKSIFFNENVQILIKISLTFDLTAPINNIPALVQIMAWCRPGEKPLSEPMMVSLLTHICVTRPQWVNCHMKKSSYTMVPVSLRTRTSKLSTEPWRDISYLFIHNFVVQVSVDVSQSRSKRALGPDEPTYGESEAGTTQGKTCTQCGKSPFY